MALLVGNDVLSNYTFEKEDEFEQVVVKLSDYVFGPQTIYLDIKKVMKSKNVASIPDGYLIDMTSAGDPKLYVIENEIVKHDPFKHIGIQMLKFATSFEESQTSIRGFLMNHISKDPDKLKRLEQGCKASNSRNIDHYLDKVVYNEFKGLVLIDEARPELHRVLEKINADISVLEVKCFVSTTDNLHMNLILYMKTMKNQK
ncbi:hypothetical protein [Desulfitobacterium sp. PCE1]|uniref:hypothetical protein n=1 Tax=Desulfitobacterium sp. PCE1 TaxID=146907 RepID=UPI00035CE142|nr:hypothetical protein [Desulfitobacterium sp. PCE1]